MTTVPQTSPAPAPAGTVSEEITFGIRYAGAEWTLAAELLVPAGGASTVQVLLPGLTYDRRYWTVPGELDYSAHMLRAGHAVLLLDRLGTGASSRPDGHQVNLDSHVASIHHVVQELRTGTPAGRWFPRVVTIGHSYGSGLAIVEAARHRDVDAVVVTGMLHAQSGFYKKVDKVHEFFHPAGQDPLLAGSGAPADYLTQRPGRRARMLEYAPGIDPELSDYNERIKSTATWGEGNSLPETYLAEYSRAIEVPVLVVVGEHDALFAGDDIGFAAESTAVQQYEQDYYSPSAQLEAHVIPGCGHSLNLHRDAPRCYALTRAWLARHLPAGPQ
ncbi:alpha/beta hydrolase [Streptomyces boninensis]|uniref:alpha/beta hydrolase n=1 Tax=Streptomyces boninensis TaxID=2039455 RepID=UPI003B21B003